MIWDILLGAEQKAPSRKRRASDHESPPPVPSNPPPAPVSSPAPPAPAPIESSSIGSSVETPPSVEPPTA